MGSFVNPNDKVELVETEEEMRLNDNPNEDKTPRVITIRAKMNYKLSKQVQGASVGMGEDGKTELNIGDGLMQLPIRNILAWRGGDLEGVPCNAEHICMLNPTDPFIDRVINEIGERNKKKESPNLTSQSAVTGSTGDGSHDSSTKDQSLTISLATGRSSTPLQSVITGRLNKSENSTPTS